MGAGGSKPSSCAMPQRMHWGDCLNTNSGSAPSRVAANLLDASASPSSAQRQYGLTSQHAVATHSQVFVHMCKS